MALVRRQFLRIAAASLAAAPLGLARAQAYPARPVRVIVPVAAGGPVDVITRQITQRVAESWGAQVHVENVPAGAGNVATGLLAKAPADGHTLAAVTTAVVINPSLAASVAYDPVKDFAPITMIGASPHVLVVQPALPAGNVQELVALVRGNPGKYSYASPGTGQSGQLAGEMFRLACGLDLAHVPFNGATPAITSTMTGQTPIAFMSLAAAAGAIRERQLRALAVTSAARSQIFPDIPTMAESGIADQVSAFWQGLVFPAGTPADLVRRWHQAVVEVIARPELKQRLAAMSFEVVAGSPEEFAARISDELPRWRKVIEAARVKRLNE